MSIVYTFVTNFQFAFDIPSILILLLNSAIYAIALGLYFKALNRDDTTIIVIMFQLIPVFILLISPLILGEQTIKPLQLVGGAIITFAAIFLTYEPARKKFNKNRLIRFRSSSYIFRV
jgi:drug/metabolite transporter (DMT)-like permease